VYAAEFRDSYFHHAFDYGGGGHGYGVSLGFHTTDCLVENNIFRHLRHAMMVQVGACGNVFGYNYSLENVQGTGETNLNQGWTPCDISLHGHYPYCNLFEGNVVQEIDVADYWGPCGPGNTFLRNEVLAEGLEIFDYSHGQNVVGNEIGSGRYGLLIDTSVEGTLGHGNDVNGSVQWDDSIADHTIPVSYYLTVKPWFFGDTPWPIIGPDVIGTATLVVLRRHAVADHRARCDWDRDPPGAGPLRERPVRGEGAGTAMACRYACADVSGSRRGCIPGGLRGPSRENAAHAMGQSVQGVPAGRWWPHTRAPGAVGLAEALCSTPCTTTVIDYGLRLAAPPHRVEVPSEGICTTSNPTKGVPMAGPDATALPRFDVFAGLAQSEVERIAALGRELTFADGDVIVEESAQSTDLFILLEGRVNVEMALPGAKGETLQLALLRAGEIFGEIAFLRGKRRTACVRALGEAKVLRIDGGKLGAFLGEDTHVGYMLMRNVATILAERVMDVNFRWRQDIRDTPMR
jgi:hypothetical protein